MSQARAVSFDGPAPDNALFSELAMDDGGATNGDVMIADGVIAQQIASAKFAVTCKLEPSEAVRAYVEAGIAPATRRAYKADLDHFRAWGGGIPTTDIQLATYLADQATTLKAATLTRRLAAISIAHKAQRLPSPVSSSLVQATMRGVRREHGTAQRQAARSFVRTSSSFSGRWAIGLRTSGIGLCY
jgi:hypothetical protein